MSGRTETRGSRAEQLAAATPDTRNRYVDLLRIVSIAMVVLGHWLIAVLGSGTARSSARTSSRFPAVVIGTWVFQVMPIFFLVGGYTNAISWDSAMRRGQTPATGCSLATPGCSVRRSCSWPSGRCSRCSRWRRAAVEHGARRRREVSLPLWFLSVYVLVVAAAPALLTAHRRVGGGLLLVLVAGTVLADTGHYGLDQAWMAIANYAFVWLAMLELVPLARRCAHRSPASRGRSSQAGSSSSAPS